MVEERPKAYIWKSPEALGSAVTMVMAASLAIYLASAIVGIAFGASAAYESGPMAPQYTVPQLLRLIVDLLKFGALVSASVTVFWILRVSRNAHLFRPAMKMSPVAAIAWYFVPVASLWKPYEAMREIWDASSMTPDEGAGRLLGAWWAAYVFAGVVGSVSLFARSSIPVDIASDLATLPVTALLILVVRRLTAMQEIKHSAVVFSDPAEVPSDGPWGGIIQ